MKPRMALLLCVLAAASPRWARAQTAAGTEPFDFLLLDAGARAVALGGAYTALATDANALLYNPAGLGMVKSNEVTFMHNQYVEGLTQEYAGFSSLQGFGANFNYLNFGSLTRTTYSQQNGTDGTFSIGDMAVSAGYGRALGSLSLGVGVKYIRESLDNVTASGYAADVGALYSVEALHGLTLGASALNIGPEVKFLNNKEKLPLNFRGGAAYSFSALKSRTVLAADVSKTRMDKFRMGTGVEISMANIFALRGGFTTRNDAGIGITGGVGVTWRSLGLDYAFVPFGDLGFSHRVSLTCRWGS